MSEVDAFEQHKVSSTSSSSARHPPKFRLSCDSCFTAKVKCSKERPTCSRCASLDFTCVYSPSRRTGKPRSSRNGPPAAGVPSSTNAPSLSLPRSRSPLAPSSPDLDTILRQRSWNFDQSETGGVPRSTVLERLTDMPLLSSLDDLNIDFVNASSGASSCQNNSYTNLGTLCQQPTHSTLRDTYFDQNTFNQNSISTADGMAPAFVDDSLTMMGGPIPTFNSSSAPTEVLPSLLLSEEMQCVNLPLGSKSDELAAKNSIASCNCSPALHDTLSKLYTPFASFDHLLAINQSSINRITLHIFCTCPPDISSIMLVSVIITKIMHWYKMAKDGKGLQNKTLTLGTFRMDEKDEHRIKMGLVKSELRKVEMLLSLFPDRFETYLGGNDKRVYEANMAFLERTLYDTTKGL